MQPELFIAFFSGLTAMLGWGFAEFGTKKSVDKIGTVSSLVWAHLFGTIILFFFLLINHFIFNNFITRPSSTVEWIGLAFFGCLQTAVYFYAYRAFEKGQIAILSPIFASFSGLVALFSVLVFGEVLKISFIPALILIFVGIMLLNIDVASLKLKRIRIIGAPGVRDIAIATVLATFWTLGWNQFTGEKDWAIYTFFMFVFMTLSAFAVSKLQKVNLSNVNPGTWKFLWLIAFGEAAAYLGISLGYSSTSFTSIIAILSGASSLPTIILARVFLKEKVAAIQTVGSLVVIIGIVLLSIS